MWIWIQNWFWFFSIIFMQRRQNTASVTDEGECHAAAGPLHKCQMPPLPCRRRGSRDKQPERAPAGNTVCHQPSHSPGELRDWCSGTATLQKAARLTHKINIKLCVAALLRATSTGLVSVPCVDPSLSTREAKQNPQNHMASAQLNISRPISLSPPYKVSWLYTWGTLYMGHFIYGAQSGYSATIFNFICMVLFPLGFFWLDGLHPSCSSAGIERGWAFTLEFYLSKLS